MKLKMRFSRVGNKGFTLGRTGVNKRRDDGE